MKYSSYARAIVFVGIGALAACAGYGSNGGSPLPGANQTPSLTADRMVSPSLRANCARPTRYDEMECLSLVRIDLGGALPNGYHGEDFSRASMGFSGYKPAQLRSAYGIANASTTGGKGQTVALVDAFGYPGAQSDLRVYRANFGLPKCTTANHCLRIVNQFGQPSPLPSPNVGWDYEQALDLDMVSAICPNCKIILVQAQSNTGKSLYDAVAEAGLLGANAISNSYGTLPGNENRIDPPEFDQTGRVITASAGDEGTGASQPCSFAGVVCVGGTTLTRDNSARGWSEVAWSGTGSGCSAKVAKPSWQTDSGCTMRSESDISAVADPGVAAYFAKEGGWIVLVGTSISSPIVASMYALAGNAATVDAPRSIWEAQHKAAKFNDVKTGSNGSCPAAMAYICNAGPGYDGPTGWGTPKGLGGL